MDGGERPCRRASRAVSMPQRRLETSPQRRSCPTGARGGPMVAIAAPTVESAGIRGVLAAMSGARRPVW